MLQPGERCGAVFAAHAAAQHDGIVAGSYIGDEVVG
jgi:hypothetical protein